jgi:ubiquinone/menaquinone biosynthesis C-methylase UbiE
MTARGPASRYVLGNTEAEHERLARQAARYDPITERLFREAGIGPGQRVLDLGSGAGDVAMLAARLVGPSGEVVGVERDSGSIAHARARVAEAGLLNVRFTESDVSEISTSKPFDAAVGRFILMFLPDPVSIVRSLFQLVRPGGVIAFNEPSWIAWLKLSAQFPLSSVAVSLLHEAFQRGGANTEMGPALYRVFREAGLPAPTMRMEMPFGENEDCARWLFDTLQSVRPQIEQLNIYPETLGDFDTLGERLRIELAASNDASGWVAVVGAWSIKPRS